MEAIPELIKAALGADVDYAMLVKQYDGRARYIGAERFAVVSNPDMARCSTSLVERQNLTMRGRSPAQAAGLATRRYTMAELYKLLQL